MKSTRALAIAILTLLITGACSLHRIDGEARPSINAPDVYSSQISQQDSDKPESTQEAAPWWQAFNRPQLAELIEQSFKANQNIVQALARVKQARAMHTSSRSEWLPSLDLEASASESRRGDAPAISSDEYGAALNWEIDLFKRIGSAAKADKLRSLAKEEELTLTKLSLSAEVANAYFGAVAAHNNLQLLNEQLETDNKLLDLAELRQQNGLGTRVEILQQASRVADSESLIPLAEAQLRTHENRLDVLLGEAPDGVNRVDADESLLLDSSFPVSGVPVDLLLTRPDLRAAQAELVAADADIAAAIADRLPRLSLEGSYLYDNGSSADPLSVLTGNFVLPLLDWGKRRAMVKRNKALYTEKLASFTQDYLLAIEEVENTLYQHAKQDDYVRLLDKRRELLQATVEETEARYTQGISDYLPVLNALQELRSVERDLLTEQLILVKLRITLHRALGGNIALTPK